MRAPGSRRAAVAVAALVVTVAAGGGAPRRTPAVGTVTALYWPADLQVTQRGDDNVGTVAFLGVVAGDATSVQARAVLLRGGSGRGVPWTALQGFGRSDTRFSGYLRLAAGGWYWVEARAVYRGVAGAVFTVGRVGVGEVFLTAGQSNAVNSGEHDPAFVPDPRFSSFNGTRWTPGSNPLRFDMGGGGSPWPYLANRLVAALDVPVGFCPCGYGGTGVADWQPGVRCPFDPRVVLFNRLASAVLCLEPRGGVRAVLWHQGESDRFVGVTPYRDRLTNLIVQLRRATGVDTPWGVALVSYIPGARVLQPGESPTDPAVEPQSIRLAQDAVARSVPGCFVGPTTDDLGPPFRYPPNLLCHFNVLGLKVHGGRWADVLLGDGSPIPKALRRRD